LCGASGEAAYQKPLLIPRLRACDPIVSELSLLFSR